MWAIALWLTAPLWVFANNSTCYYKDGNTDSAAFPCNNNRPMCCPENHICLDNGLCFLSNENYFGRYSCTDKSWPDACPQNCLRTEGGNEAVKQCPDGRWCCNWDQPEKRNEPSCCEMADRVLFEFGDGYMFAMIKEGSAVKTSGSPPIRPEPPLSSGTGASTTGLIAGPPRFTSRSDPAAPTAIGTSERSSTSATAIGSSASAASATSSPSSPSSSSSSIPSSAEPKSLSTAGVVGLAVGVPLAVAAICVITWLLYTKRKERKEIQRQATPLDFSPDATEKTGPLGGRAPPVNNNRTSKTSSEIDSREMRVPIQPQDTAHMAAANSSFQRDQTTSTLYPNVQPNYSNGTSPPLPTTTTTSSMFSNPSQDYSEWAVTPRLQQQRWSGTTAQDGGMGSGRGNGGRCGQGNTTQVHEIMGRQIPPTIAELP